ncbi:hypothetical protein VTK56DRAFT_7359 [Thermocarpiscus australiensis]
MVPVRKPGRPLSTCPCPPGRPCACGGVRVAIPKKQKCGCPTGTPKETDETEQELPPVETPTSPSRPSFRVSKSTCCSKTSNRKQSFDLANLERMDPNSINLITAPNSNGVTNGMAAVSSSSFQGSPGDLTGFRAGMGFVPAGIGGAYGPSGNPGYGAPVAYGTALQYAQSNHHGVKIEDGNLVLPPNADLGAAMQPPPFVNGNHASPSISNAPQPAARSPPLMPKANGSASGCGSCCCGNKTEGLPPASNNVSEPQQGYEQPYVQQFQPSMDIAQFPTVFTYPAEYGSWQHPINPAIWQQIASHPNMPLGTSISPGTNGESADVGPSHQCNCGEGCQCVGCLAHPFNAQMFQYVNNAYSESASSSPGGGTGPSAADGGGGQQPQAAAGRHDDSPPEAATPSEGSPGREEQSLSTLDYFFVNLPISGLCGGSFESCPCGDSCGCPGCLVHHVPLRQG